MNKLNVYFNAHKSQLQVAWFLVFGLCALIAQLVSRIICDIIFQNLTNTITIWPFPSQTLGSFLAFLVSNIIAKVISFITNRKKTFQANNNIYLSIILYVILVVILIIVETIIGTPLQNAIYTMIGGSFINSIQATMNASSQFLYQICGVVSQLIYGIGDAIIVFFMDKYIIMRKN
ncbi:MAG: hypothetical protein LUF02_01055 [Erysipelotrichaceae bacterium]|nr:hypothetical protein [Erysipelotrichaceae bacterium]